jgi:NodT family efflux transporter outer membrane factor (OMF) lipoprotein
VAANATLAEAREEVTVAGAAFLPTVSAAAGAQRAGTGAVRTPGAGATANLYSIGLSTSYSPDIFGGTRRAVEQQQALANYQRNELAAAYLTLTGNVVNEVLTITSTRLQITTTEDLIASDRKNLALTQRAFEVGIVPRSDVLTADSQLAADLTQLPSLHKQLDQAYDALAVLAGRAPSEWQVQPFDIEQFTLPRDIPLSLPARLVRQRPDVLAAEMQLHAASAAIGVAVAQEFSRYQLVGFHHSRGAAGGRSVSSVRHALGGRGFFDAADIQGRSVARAGACRARCLRGRGRHLSGSST